MAPENRAVLSRAVMAGILVAAIGLSACGRKGALEAPPSAAVKTTDDAQANPGVRKPDKPFFLDPLL